MMNRQVDDFLDKYFQDRPQLKRPDQYPITGEYQIGGSLRGALLNLIAENARLTAQLEQKWLKIKDHKPEHGQWIFGCTENFDPWYEQYDQDEPHGLMRYWCPAPPPTQQEGE